MPQETIQQFFHQKRAAVENRRIDWKRKTEEWRQTIARFYNRIQQYFNDAIKAHDVDVKYRPTLISEEEVGTYEVNEMVLSVGSEKAIFTPNGMNVVGGTGRIALHGDMGEVTLVHKSKDRWYIILSRIPEQRVVELNETTLLEALRGVMRS